MGYSRYVVLAAAFSAMFIISPSNTPEFDVRPYRRDLRLVARAGALMFTTFIIFQSVGMLPRMLRATNTGRDGRPHRRIVFRVGICPSRSGLVSAGLGALSVGSFLHGIHLTTTPSLRGQVVATSAA